MSQREAKFTHVVSFRLTDEQALKAERLRAAFEDQTWAEMGRWLFSDRRVLAAMENIIEEAEVEVEWELEPA